MHRIFLLAIAIFSLSGVMAQQHNGSMPGKDLLELKETFYNFGKIPQSKPVYTEFEVFNKGTNPLTLTSVTAACGCTTPEWNREPIPAGGSTKIKVGFNAAAEGYFEKPVTIMYGDNQTKLFTVKGTVWKAPEGSAPPNASISFLKQINQ